MSSAIRAVSSLFGRGAKLVTVHQIAFYAVQQLDQLFYFVRPKRVDRTDPTQRVDEH